MGFIDIANIAKGYFALGVTAVLILAVLFALAIFKRLTLYLHHLLSLGDGSISITPKDIDTPLNLESKVVMQILSYYFSLKRPSNIR